MKTIYIKPENNLQSILLLYLSVTEIYRGVHALSQLKIGERIEYTIKMFPNVLLFHRKIVCKFIAWKTGCERPIDLIGFPGKSLTAEPIYFGKLSWIMLG